GGEGMDRLDALARGISHGRADPREPLRRQVCAGELADPRQGRWRQGDDLREELEEPLRQSLDGGAAVQVPAEDPVDAQMLIEDRGVDLQERRTRIARRLDGPQDLRA